MDENGANHEAAGYENDDFNSGFGSIFGPCLEITAPIYYVNGLPHLGHLYTSTAVDICARFYRLLENKRVFASFGTDEHGQKVQLAAETQNLTPQEFVDQMNLPFKNMLNKAHIKYDIFIRTTSSEHIKVAQHFWSQLLESGLVYSGHYEGWYSKTDEAYYKDSEVKNGVAIETGAPVEHLREACHFFKLSAMRNALIEHYKDNPESIQPKTRYAEVMGLLKVELPDLAVSRSRFNWGIPVPGSNNEVMYVWIDALVNYLTVIGYPKNLEYMEWWNNSIHIIGKDILKFHAIYWPAFLMAVKIRPPKRIFAHGWWNVNNQKMSKSLGNVVDPFELFNKYDIDSLRYYLFKEVNFGSDGVFSEESLKSIMNTELLNELGNLIQRILMFCYNKYGTTLSFKSDESDILAIWSDALTKSKKAMIKQDISLYVNIARNAVIETNRYIDTVKPWKLEDPSKVLGKLCLCIQRLSVLYYPIMPNKMVQVAEMLGFNIFHYPACWDYHLAFPLSKPEGIFSRY